MECLRCGHGDTMKSGFARGKQRYECKQCHYHFVERVELTDPRKPAVVKLYCSGVSFRQAARLEGISHTTARRWVKDFAQEQLPTRPAPAEPVSVVEVDEMWHDLKKS